VNLLKRCHFDLGLSATRLAVPSLISFVGSSQILFGNDLPFMPQSFLDTMIDYLDTFETEHRDVFRLIESDNAIKLLPRRSVFDYRVEA
jgi:6-methylsalicylate decarboxylase